MRKQISVLALLLVMVAATQAFAQTATVVTQSGQRLRGEIVSMAGYDNSGYDNQQYGNRRSGTDNRAGEFVTMRIYGREEQIPTTDIAVIDFTGSGNFSRAEMERA